MQSPGQPAPPDSVCESVKNSSEGKEPSWAEPSRAGYMESGEEEEVARGLRAGAKGSRGRRGVRLCKIANHTLTSLSAAADAMRWRNEHTTAGRHRIASSIGLTCARSEECRCPLEFVYQSFNLLRHLWRVPRRGRCTQAPSRRIEEVPSKADSTTLAEF